MQLLVFRFLLLAHIAGGPGCVARKGEEKLTHTYFSRITYRHAKLSCLYAYSFWREVGLMIFPSEATALCSHDVMRMGNIQMGCDL